MLHRDEKYPSDLSEQQWEPIKDLIPAASVIGRPRVTSIRKIINAILFLTRTGCAWRYLPKEYPPWRTVYDYFCKYRDQGVWSSIHQTLAQKVRFRSGKSLNPRFTIIDAQSVRAHYGEERGYDGFKKLRGRKRQILVESLGIIWAVKVHKANQSDGTKAHEVIQNYPKEIAKLEKLLGDFGYGKSPFDIQLNLDWGIWPTVNKGTAILKTDKHGRNKRSVQTSNLRPKRWIGERTFAWFNHTRRLSRDYERQIKTSEVFLFISQ